MPLIKDLIHIPERVHQGDFVLKLSEGVNHAEQTLRDYVVTPQLVGSFDDALGFIKQSVQSSSSKAAYLHGSFGAGKSHFMAVLNLLLAGNLQARAITELADVVARHNGWIDGRKFLLVPYHMIGARSMESAILGQYADHVRALHPEAPIPGFYLAEGLFHDASRMREQLGDEAFFASLNEGQNQGGDGWGDLSAGWSPVSFDAAMLEAPNGDERARLVGDLIAKFFSSYASLAESRGEAFVSLDDGLSIMSRHAQSLGYDAVILFLDEMVLWLASHAADASFVTREGTKLVKLVEATNADRPIPLVSFVARQRDLSELVGENLAGSLQVNFSDVLKHWEARFHKVNLDDRNLPAIAEKRILRPVNEAARQTLAQAFQELTNVRQDVFDTLLTSTADRDMFRKVYPFSPALVQTLIAVSAALQRERTALKLMLQLLVDRREDLELGQLIPVGDLYDAITDGDEPFSDAMRIHFENAKKLYSQKLLPMLEREHGITWEEIRLGTADQVKAKNLRNEARLLKTLILAALVPEVESLKALTAQRLTALNHGTFRSPIPGREAQDVLRKCRNWAAEIGEIKITEDTNPLISIQVTGIDIEPIVRGAEREDNPGNRRRKIREVLFDQLGVRDTAELFASHEVSWRGTRREVEVVYENVREMADDRLRTRTESWSVVIDFPFDDANRGPQDDLARLNDYRGGDTRTLVWIPSFLSETGLRELGRLVVLDYILQGDRFANYAAHLSLVDRVQAQALAKNQRDQLLQKLRQNLEVAYGISTEPRSAIMTALAAEDQFRSLDPTLSPRPPVGANLKSAFESLLGQLFAHQYPAHPEFDTEIRPAIIKKIWPEVQRAIESTDGRTLVQDTATRKLIRSVIDPSKMGRMGETHLLIEQHWRTHFVQCHARVGGELTVKQLRDWMDLPQPMGLPAEVQNLIILAYAAQTNRRFFRQGGPVEPTIESMQDDLELREQTLPGQEHWQLAISRAGRLFGLTVAETLNAANVGKLVDDVRAKVRQQREPIGRLVSTLDERVMLYPAATNKQSRLVTARSAQALLAAIHNAEESQVVEVLAKAVLETSEAAMSQTLSKASQLDEVLRLAAWDLFDAMRNLTDVRQTAAEGVLSQLGDALAADEHVIPLQKTIDVLRQQALGLLTAPAPAPAAVPTPVNPIPSAPEPSVVVPVPGRSVPVIVDESEAVDLSADRATEVFDSLSARMKKDPGLRLSLSWRLSNDEGIS